MLVKSFLTPQRKEELKAFIGLVEKNPQVLYHPELAFFKSFLEHFGAKIPEQEKPKPKPEPEPKKQEAPEEKKETEMKDADEEKEEEEEPEEPEQPDDELMTPDTNFEELPLGDEKKEVSDDDRSAAGEAKMKAVAAQNEGKLDEALKLFTESIEKNPTSSLTYGSRAALLLKMKRPNAAIRDCNRALQMNPESAKALKVRGKAYRYIGEYEKAKKDLQAGNKIDFDDDSFAMQKFLEDRLRGKERRELARAAREREREAARKQREFEERKRKWEEQRRREQEEEEREERERQQQQQGGMPGMGGMGGMPAGINEIFSDPEVMAAMQDPATQSKLLEVLQSRDPAKFMEAQQDPKIGPVLTKILSKLGSQAGAGGCGCSGGACGRGGCGGGGCGCGGAGCGGAGFGGMPGFQFPH